MLMRHRISARKLKVVSPMQARRQQFSEGGSFDTAGGFGGRSRLPEALGYLVQNPAI